MYAFCIESSHSRGMGHLFRSIHFARYLQRQGERSIFFINQDKSAFKYLDDQKISYVVVSLDDVAGNWEKELIKRHSISTWINDRLDTDAVHAKKIKSEGIKLITFDDRGTGASYADIHVAGLLFDDLDSLQGKRILNGFKYIILNEEIAEYRHQRNDINRIVISMGATDTYGVTFKVIDILRNTPREITVIVGPGFRHSEQLQETIPDHFTLKKSVPSLIEEFAKYDMAITGGGLTLFEACASGLPCIVIANEYFEVPVGRLLESESLCYFAGHHEKINKDVFDQHVNIQEMSLKGMQMLDLDAGRRIYEEIKQL